MIFADVDRQATECNLVQAPGPITPMGNGSKAYTVEFEIVL